MLFMKVLVVASLVCQGVCQWGYSNDQMEVFDLADEFKGNFYEFLDISQSATTNEIRRAYRKLSLVMHPDRNKTEGAEENFRILAAIYEVLKTKEKREIYDDVLVNGIPSAYLYVPKPLRKMSLTEVSIIIAVVLTCGHYLILWGSYAEKRLILEQKLEKRKKLKPKKKSDSTGAEETDNLTKILVKPRLLDLLPFAIVRGVYFIIRFLPGFIKERREEAERLKEEERLRQAEEEELEQLRKEELEKREEQKAIRKQKAKEKREEMLQYIETSVKDDGNFYSPFESGGNIEELEDMYGSSDEDDRRKSKKIKQWSTENESQLFKLMAKFPVGSSQRWHKIADEMDMDVSEVIKRAKQIKGNIGAENTKARQKIKRSDKVNSDAFKDMATLRVPEDNEQCSDVINNDGLESWTSDQQKLFEMALRQFQKGTPARWDKIAKCVPNKSKEECVTRYKQLAEMVQQKHKR